jgi:PKD domain/Pectate lyase superfamily protein
MTQCVVSCERFLTRLWLIAFVTLPISTNAAAVAATIEPQTLDSSGLAAAIRQAAPGDRVYLPAGSYALTEAIQPKSGIQLVGAGQDQTRLVYAGTKPTVLIALNGCEDVEVAQLMLDARDNPLVHQGIGGSNSRRLWLHHLTIRNLASPKTWGPHGILFSGQNPSMEGGVTDSKISDCRMENIGVEAEYGGGIRLAWGCVRNQVLGNLIDHTGRGGIFGDHSAELIIRKNRVTRSGGEGLGIEIWGGCPRSLIEDNVVDHWLSVDQGHQSAVRRNVIGTDDGTLKGYGIEIIARDVVVTDNDVKRGARIGLSVSNQPVKNNVFWGYNTVGDCLQWGAQLQGETGGIAHHYFYRCVFENTVRGDSRATYPQDSGHGFRTNGACRQMVWEDCAFRNNGGYGVQFGGRDVDEISLVRCAISGNQQVAVTGPSQYTALDFVDCQVQGNKSDQLPAVKPFAGPPPVADFRVPELVRAGQSVRFQCTSRAVQGTLAERLWDFSDGIPEVTDEPQHSFDQAGKYRVTLVVWDSAGRGGRAERTIEVLPK